MVCFQNLCKYKPCYGCSFLSAGHFVWPSVTTKGDKATHASNKSTSRDNRQLQIALLIILYSNTVQLFLTVFGSTFIHIVLCRNVTFGHYAISSKKRLCFCCLRCNIPLIWWTLESRTALVWGWNDHIKWRSCKTCLWGGGVSFRIQILAKIFRWQVQCVFRSLVTWRRVQNHRCNFVFGLRMTRKSCGKHNWRNSSVFLGTFIIHSIRMTKRRWSPAQLVKHQHC